MGEVTYWNYVQCHRLSWVDCPHHRIRFDGRQLDRIFVRYRAEVFSLMGRFRVRKRFSADFIMVRYWHRPKQTQAYASELF